MHSAVSHIPSQSDHLEPTKLYKLKKKARWLFIKLYLSILHTLLKSNVTSGYYLYC